MKYLITGGAGYIGSHMVNFLKKTNSEITILDNLSTGHSYNIIDCEFINLDLRDKDKLFKKLHKRKFDGVFHFAGKSIVSESLIDPKSYYENNIIGTNNLLELIVKNDLNNFIFSSSAAVYGNTNVDLISEDHTKIPSNPYGESKLKAEKLINTTYDSMMKAIKIVKEGIQLGDIGSTIQNFVEAEGFSVVQDFCGHGIGQTFHKEPSILHYGQKGTGERIKAGMIFTIEPMINIGNYETKVLNDGWTAVTRDKSLSAQFEHTVGITKDGYEIFTQSKTFN